MVDWSKPIMHRNGEPVKLCHTFTPEEPGQFGPEYPRLIHRTQEKVAQASLWWVKEDGTTHWPGGEFDIINVPQN